MTGTVATRESIYFFLFIGGFFKRETWCEFGIYEDFNEAKQENVFKGFAPWNSERHLHPGF